LTPVDAVVPKQIRRLLWTSIASDVVRRGDDELALFAPELYSDHVAFQELAESCPDVIAAFDDVGDGVVDRHVDNDIRISLVKSAEDRLEISAGGHTRHVHPKHSRRGVA
jgi:hypothetical protein